MSNYLVLGRDNNGTWRELKHVAATGAEHAVRIVAAKADQTSVFIAVPERSWSPMKVDRVQKTHLKLSEAAVAPSKPLAAAETKGAA